MFDLLIKGARVIDPAQDIDDVLDLAVKDKVIAQLSKDVPAKGSKEVIDGAGKIVTPGLIDSHCHSYYGVTHIGGMPDDMGVKQGVTTIVDAGSAGQATFEGFRRFIVEPYQTSVLCFLHLGSIGLTMMPEIQDMKEVDVEAASAVIESNMDIIKGVKLRLLGPMMIREGPALLETAKRVACKFGLPIMVHLGDPERLADPMLTLECLRIMDRGDIVSHIYTGQRGGIIQKDGRVPIELEQAVKRGVSLDMAPGIFNFSFEVAQRLIMEGILPDIISTDLTGRSLSERVYSLTVSMSKMMALGLSVNEVIERTTLYPARVLGVADRLGSLMVGHRADISILQMTEDNWLLEDSNEDIIEARDLIIPVTTIKDGKIIPAQLETMPKKSGL